MHGGKGACVGYDEIWSMSGRYASYWNAFLFEFKLWLQNLNKTGGWLGFVERFMYKLGHLLQRDISHEPPVKFLRSIYFLAY